MIISKETDLYETPSELMRWLHRHWDFHLDLCCDEKNCRVFSSAQDTLFDWCKDNNLEYDCLDDRVFQQANLIFGQYYPWLFINPPYSNVEPFLKAVWEKWTMIGGVVMLIPTRCLTAKYFDILDLNEGKTINRKWKDGVTIYPLSRRVAFTHPTLKVSNPSFDCCLVQIVRAAP